MIKIKTIGLGKDFITKQIAFVTTLVDVNTQKMAKITETVIRGKISESIKRTGSTGSLASAFFAEPINGGWGVGNIDFLNTNAKMWRHVNFGSEAIGAKTNYWVPKGAFQPGGTPPSAGGGSQRWGDGKYSFKFTGIPASNYIEKTLAEIPMIIQQALSENK